ncbi:MAG: RsmD family RNA methyltransferase, partial [Gemmatimonadota bacterium]
ASARFVESDPAAFRLLRRNVEELGLVERVELRRADVFGELTGLASDGFDVALADPPYGTDAARLVDVWLDEPFAGILCVEHARAGSGLPEADWYREYGDTALSFYIASEES